MLAVVVVGDVVDVVAVFVSLDVGAARTSRSKTNWSVFDAALTAAVDASMIVYLQTSAKKTVDHSAVIAF